MNITGLFSYGILTIVLRHLRALFMSLPRSGRRFPIFYDSGVIAVYSTESITPSVTRN